MLIWSHALDLYAKIISIILFVMFMKNGPGDAIQSFAVSTSNPGLVGFLGFAAVGVLFYFVFHRPIMDVLASAVYARLQFGVRASWDQARSLRRLFSLNRYLRWFPMNNVLELPQEQRLSALLAAAEVVSAQSRPIRSPISAYDALSKPARRVLDGMVVVSIVLLFYFHISDQGPVYWMETRIAFQTGLDSPGLAFLLTLLPIVLFEWGIVFLADKLRSEKGSTV